MSDELKRVLADRDVDVAELVRLAEADARAEAGEILRRMLVDDLLRRAASYLDRRELVALAGVGEGVRPLVLELRAGDLDDEARLEQSLRAHNELLLEALEQGGVVVPFRFGTTYESRAELDAWVERHREALEHELDRLRGAAEWSVEILGRRDEGSSGGYLESRLATAVRADTREQLVAASVERIGDAYLVAASQRERFGTAIAELEADGFEVRVTGPWPPYSFARLP